MYIMSDYADIGQYAAAAMAQTGNTIAQSNFNYKNTKRLAEYQNQMNIANWKMQNERQDQLNANEYITKVNAAQRSGLSPLAVLGGSSYNAAGGTIASSTSQPVPVGSFLPSIFESLLQQKQLDNLDATTRETNANAEAQELENLHSRSFDNTLTEELNKYFDKDGIDKPFQYYNKGDLMALELVRNYDFNLDETQTKKLENNLNRAINEGMKNDPKYLESLREQVIQEVNKKKAEIENTKKNTQKTQQDIDVIESSNVLYMVDKMIDNPEDITIKDVAKVAAAAILPGSLGSSFTKSNTGKKVKIETRYEKGKLKTNKSNSKDINKNYKKKPITKNDNTKAFPVIP